MKNEKKILIIEDDKFIRDLCQKKFSNLGFNVVVADNGEEGLEKCKKEKPDVVLLDIVMPKVDGFEILRRIKEDQSISFIPIIILSNLGQETDIKKGIALGANDYLVKANFTADEIVDKIRKYI